MTEPTTPADGTCVVCGHVEGQLQPLAGYLLTPRQEIRARALDSAAVMLGPMVEPGEEDGAEELTELLDSLGAYWLKLARQGAVWVEHGDTEEPDRG